MVCVLRTQIWGVSYGAFVETLTNWRYLVSPRPWSHAFLGVSMEDPFLLLCELLSTPQAFEDEFLVWLKILALMGYFWKVLIRILSVSGMGRSPYRVFLWLRYLISRPFPGSYHWWVIAPTGVLVVEHLRYVYKVEESMSASRRGPFDWLFRANLSQFTQQLFSCIWDVSSSCNKNMMA